MRPIKPAVDGTYLLQKFPGKGGWTYAQIPEIKQNKNNPFGWVKVKGTVDGFVLKQYKLMPMGKGKLFLPLKASIRNTIGKEAGDYIQLVLSVDDDPYSIPDEIKSCFDEEPKTTLNRFMELSEGERKRYIDWIYESKTEDAKALRILKMMERIPRGLKFADKDQRKI